MSSPQTALATSAQRIENPDSERVFDARAAAAVSEARLAARLADMAAIGATPKGGVCRLSLSPEDATARALLCQWALARGFGLATDGIGNLFVRRPGTDPTAAPVMTGSHLDTQPTGGRFDGVYGVLAGFEALEALEDAGVRTRRPIEAVAWTNEEGARFQPGCMGSAVFAGAMALGDALACRDGDGETVKRAVEGVHRVAPAMPMRPFGFDPRGAVDSYVEAHIEQGPRLEATGRTIGVVTGIQGARWFQVEFVGEEAHAGTTPHSVRKDALKAAVATIAALEKRFVDPEDTTRFTVGRMTVSPGSPNTIPGRVTFTIDLRDPSADTVKLLGDMVAPMAAAHAQGCAVTVKETFSGPPVVFDPMVVDLVRAAADHLGFPSLKLPSGANHDAKFIARLAPTGMIFIPCLHGVSHNEAEDATIADCVAGARVLAATLVALANR